MSRHLALYRAALYLVFPFVLLRTLWRGGAYRQRIAERLGLRGPAASAGCVWVHAVSVGEVHAVAGLVRALLERGEPVLLTTTTPTGSGRARALLAGRGTHVYLPWDLPGAVRRFLDRHHPRLALVAETELWPNLYRACAARGIPLLLVNARLSERSARRYARVRGLVAETLDCVTTIAARDARDAQRFMALGADAARVTVTGNLKFDEERGPAHGRDGNGGESAIVPAGRRVLMAASTHPGEDEIVLDALRIVQATHPDVLLLLAPRHPERASEVIAACRARALTVARRGAGQTPAPSHAVWLIDTLGELVDFYARCEAAFVGGSLVPVGGHNLIEPAACGVPVLTGPALEHFREVAEVLDRADARIEVRDAATLAQAFLTLLDDPRGARQRGERGREAMRAQRGALQRVLALIGPLLSGG